MHEITRQFRGEDVTSVYGAPPQTFHVYTKEEADAQGIEYVHWTDARAHDWALTDDHYVGQCLRCKVHPTKGAAYSHFLTLSFARQWVRWDGKGNVKGDPFLEFEPYLETGGFQYTAPQTWQEREAKLSRTRDFVRLYARLYIAREGRLKEQDWKLLGMVYRPDQTIAEATAKRLYKQEFVKEMINDEFKKILTDAGFDEQRVLAMYKEIYDKADDLDDTKVMKGVADTIAKLLRMDERMDVIRQTVTEEYSYEAIEESAHEALSGGPQEDDIPALLPEHQNDEKAD